MASGLLSTLLTALGFLAVSEAVPPHDPLQRLLELSSRIEQRPAEGGLYLERARVYVALADPVLALEDAERAAHLLPDNPQPAVVCGQLQWRLRRDPEALASLDRAIRLGAGVDGEEGADLRWLRGRVLAGLGRAEQALREFDAALDLLPQPAPEHFLDYVEVAHTVTGEAAHVCALFALDRGIERLGPVPALVFAAVAECEQLGRWQQAVARLDLLRARAADPRWLDPLRRRLEQVAGRAFREASVDRPVAGGSRVVPPAPAAGLGWRVLAEASAAAFQESVLVSRGSTWRYRDDFSVVGSAWRQPAFDDSGWAQGPAPLGYGDGDEATVVGYGPDAGNKYTTTWFRRSFDVLGPAQFSSARVVLQRDDGAIVYLNGVEIVRVHMPRGPIAPTDRAVGTIGDPEEAAYHSYGFDPSLLVSGTNVLAVEVHQGSADSSDISFDLELLAGDEPVALTRGPYLQNLTDSSVVVRWRTDHVESTRLWLGASPSSMFLVVDDPTPRTEHVAVLHSLPAEQRAYYAIGGGRSGVLAGGDADHHFTTLPTAGAVRPLRAWLLGDSGTGDPVARGVRDAYLRFAQQQQADMLLMLGDNAYPDGTDQDYQVGMFDVYGPILRHTPTWSTLGNHDGRSASSATGQGVYFDVFDLPAAGEAGGLPSGTEAYYSFDRGHVHFVCLDSYHSNRTAAGAMLTWLRADLASTQARWVVAYWHHPPYTKGSHDSDDVTASGGRIVDMRAVALPVLEAHGVDLVVSGHSHVYERSYLVDGHYGFSSEWDASMRLDPGDGRPGGDGSYHKPRRLRAAHQGAVYVVTGSAGKTTTSGTLDHPVMHISLRDPGSLVLDIDGDRLEGRFVNASDQVRDHFVIEKPRRAVLRRNTAEVSVARGDRQLLQLDAGIEHAGKTYLIAGSFGTSPGFSAFGVHVPLNLDAWFLRSVDAANTPIYPSSYGQLDASGRAVSAVVVPAGLPGSIRLALAGLDLWHAGIVLGSGAIDAASNAVQLRLLP